MLTHAQTEAAKIVVSLGRKHAEVVVRYALGVMTEGEADKHRYSGYSERIDAAIHTLYSSRLPSGPLGRVIENAIEEIGGRTERGTHDRISAEILDQACVTLALACGISEYQA